MSNPPDANDFKQAVLNYCFDINPKLLTTTSRIDLGFGDCRNEGCPSKRLKLNN